ncbi:hypothetical protein GCM10009827_026450 [Dactylosporangium maewongense]|uniref:PE-PGRS family protein n=1 Tax=Dactylosporangium maewongense TaxID=634393 RepID=A0ABN2A4L4_9ACTN
MDIGPVLRHLASPARLPVRSDIELAESVSILAKQAKTETVGTPYLKTPSPVAVASILQTRPADILRELGVATTFLTRSPFLSVSQHWAHVRYCATLEAGREQLMRLTSYASKDVVHHHKVTQSEQLGIGLALVVARAVLERRHPGWLFHVVDADVALRHGYVNDVTGRVGNKPGTNKRPDYFLIGWRRAGSTTKVRIAVLECKGTHGDESHVYRQLAKACLQVGTVAIGDHPMYGLMVASRLLRSGVSSYVLDPPGDDELWTGPTSDYDELLAEQPDELEWRARQQAPQPDAADPAGGTAPSTPTTAAATPTPPYVIPASHRSWLAQVMNRTVAASVLLFAGDSTTAVDYTSPRQRGYSSAMLPLEDTWPDTISAQVRMPSGPVLTGTSHLMPLNDGRTLEVFRGIDRRLHRDLKEGNLSRYARNAGWLRRWWNAARSRSRDTVSVGADGTALIIRVLDRRERPSRRRYR